MASTPAAIAQPSLAAPAAASLADFFNVVKEQEQEEAHSSEREPPTTPADKLRADSERFELTTWYSLSPPGVLSGSDDATH